MTRTGSTSPTFAPALLADPTAPAPEGAALAEAAPEDAAPQAPATPKIADEIRRVCGWGPGRKLEYDRAAGGWHTTSGDFVGRNLPTVRAAVEGYRVQAATRPAPQVDAEIDLDDDHDADADEFAAAPRDRVLLADGTDVTGKTSPADVAACRRALRELGVEVPGDDVQQGAN